MSFEISLSGVNKFLKSIENSSNNIANTSTHGFKARANIEPYQVAFTQGNMASTGGALDLAINGPGFFAFESGNGTRSFSRNGALHVDKDGFIVNNNGEYLLGFAGSNSSNVSKLKVSDVNNNISNIDVDPEGVITAKAHDSSAEKIGIISLAKFPNNNELNAVGNNSYTATFASGDAIFSMPLTSGVGAVQPKFLEESNTNLELEIVDLIKAQRNLEANVAVIKTLSEVEKSLIDLK